MVINKDTVLSIYPQWVKDGYVNAQKAVTDKFNGQDILDATQVQDDIVWAYWNKLHKAKDWDRWHEDWFFSDIKNRKKTATPIQAQGLDILSNELVNAKVGKIKNDVAPPPPTPDATPDATPDNTSKPKVDVVPAKKQDVISPDASSSTQATAPAKKGLPILPIAIGGLLIVGVIGFVMFRRSQNAE